jgi:hypothetical protein
MPLHQAKRICAMIEARKDRFQNSLHQLAPPPQEQEVVTTNDDRKCKLLDVNHITSPWARFVASRATMADCNVKTIFKTNQLTNACGYNAPAWSLMVKTMINSGQDFMELTPEMTDGVQNTQYLININQQVLNIFTPVAQVHDCIPPCPRI